MRCFELSKNSGPEKRRFSPLAVPIIGCSFTRTATTDVINGSNDVTPKTNLEQYKLVRIYMNVKKRKKK